MAEDGSETSYINPYYKTPYRVNALYSERSGWFHVFRAYVWATSPEKARDAAQRVFKGAKHIAVKKRD